MAERLRDRLVGAWRLHEYSVTVNDDIVLYPLGPDATGLIIYTPDGYMSAQLMAAGRPQYASGEIFLGTPEEAASAAAGYLAYSGPFYVDEDHGTLRHHMSVSLFPNWIGNTQGRSLQLEGDTLTLTTAAFPYEDVLLSPRLIWKRAEPNPGRVGAQ